MILKRFNVIFGGAKRFNHEKRHWKLHNLKEMRSLQASVSFLKKFHFKTCDANRFSRTCVTDDSSKNQFLSFCAIHPNQNCKFPLKCLMATKTNQFSRKFNFPHHQNPWMFALIQINATHKTAKIDISIYAISLSSTEKDPTHLYLFCLTIRKTSKNIESKHFLSKHFIP